MFKLWQKKKLCTAWLLFGLKHDSRILSRWPHSRPKQTINVLFRTTYAIDTHYYSYNTLNEFDCARYVMRIVCNVISKRPLHWICFTYLFNIIKLELKLRFHWRGAGNAKSKRPMKFLESARRFNCLIVIAQLLPVSNRSAIGNRRKLCSSASVVQFTLVVKRTITMVTTAVWQKLFAQFTPVANCQKLDNRTGVCHPHRFRIE